MDTKTKTKNRNVLFGDDFVQIDFVDGQTVHLQRKNHLPQPYEQINYSSNSNEPILVPRISTLPNRFEFNYYVEYAEGDLDFEDREYHYKFFGSGLRKVTTQNFKSQEYQCVGCLFCNNNNCDGYQKYIIKSAIKPSAFEIQKQKQCPQCGTILAHQQCEAILGLVQYTDRRSVNNFNLKAKYRMFEHSNICQSKCKTKLTTSIKHEVNFIMFLCVELNL